MDENTKSKELKLQIKNIHRIFIFILYYKNPKKQGEVAGVAQILNARSPGGFDQQDLEARQNHFKAEHLIFANNISFRFFVK